MNDKWFLELAQDYFGDDEIAAEFVENEVYSPEMLYLLDSGKLDSTPIEALVLTYWDEATDCGGDYWYDRDSDIHYRVTVI